ncbi:hypothetical protein GGI19_005808 [Coemansia pectinata]|uniref:U three protein 23 n=1 Tax=Coemansia pectinata TaxID=1052879 RepID=A0A9W8GT10_9FUNG|nr:hypothetical protein GGI19_005808 [Coemansia pectinata]
MRAKRAKSYRKAMQFYQQAFGFREPYQILVSPDFILAGVSKQVPVKARLEEAVQGQAKFLVTHCGISELLKSSSDFRTQAITASKEFEKRRCPHQEPIAGLDCIREIMGDENKNNYCVAVQDDELRAKLRTVPGVPILHVKQSVVVLERKSQVAKDASKKMEQDKLGLSELERSMLRAVKKQANERKSEKRKKKKKTAGPKGPNPLSIKKATKKPQPAKTTKSLTSKSGQEEKGVGSIPVTTPATTTTGTKRPRTEGDSSVPAKKTATVSGTPTASEDGVKHKRKRNRSAKNRGTANDSAAAVFQVPSS